jgi:hypothetical protein
LLIELNCQAVKVRPSRILASIIMPNAKREHCASLSGELRDSQYSSDTVSIKAEQKKESRRQ